MADIEVVMFRQVFSRIGDCLKKSTHDLLGVT